MLDDLVVSIKENEGYVSKPYIDPLVKRNPEDYGLTKEELEFIENNLDKLRLTVGYGTLLTRVTKMESTILLRHRLLSKIEELKDKKTLYARLPEKVQMVLAEMAYQMGVDGLLKFRKTWKYLEDWDFENAADEMLDSMWAKVQTPKRAKELSDILRNV